MSRCATKDPKGEQCRLPDDHEYRGQSHRFIGPVAEEEDK